MSMSPQPELQQDPIDAQLASLNKRLRRLFVVVIATTAFLVGVASLALVGWRRVKALDESMKNQEFSQFVSEYNADADFVSPQVNTIQFLRHGYSISFDSVQYNQDGLVLSGTIGNPTQLWISSLALNFTARPYPYKIRDKWEKDSDNPNFFPWWSSDWDIGSGQTTVGLLNPGVSAPFHVNIPNVKQSSDQIQIAVSFTGERYQYLK